MSKETTGKPARMYIPGQSVDGTHQPPQPMLAGNQSEEKLRTLDEELQEKLGKIFNSKGQVVWKQFRKLSSKGGIPSSDMQNVDSIEALFRVLNDYGKIKLGNYEFLQYILVHCKDVETVTRKLISEYTDQSETKRDRTGNDKKRGKSKKSKRNGPHFHPYRGPSSSPSQSERNRTDNDSDQGQSSGQQAKQKMTHESEKQ